MRHQRLCLNHISDNAAPAPLKSDVANLPEPYCGQCGASAPEGGCRKLARNILRIMRRQRP